MIKQWVLGASTLALSVAALAGGPAPVVSGQPYATQFYVEGHGGMTWQKWKGEQVTLLTLASAVQTVGPLSVNWKNEKDRNNFGFAAGWNVRPPVAVEVGYYSYGDVTLAGDNARQDTDALKFDGKIKSTLFYGGVRYTFYKTHRLRLFVKAAIARSNNAYDWTTVKDAPSPKTATGKNKVNFTTLMGALGVHFAFSQRLYVGAQVMYVPGKSGDFKVPAQTSADGFIGFNF